MSLSHRPGDVVPAGSVTCSPKSFVTCGPVREGTKEPASWSSGQTLVMRRLVWLLLIAATATLLIPESAAAKGSTLRFDEEQYAPGDRAVAHAQVETWPGSGQPEDPPYTVYLVRGGQPLWFGHLPTRAIPVGELQIGHQLPDGTEVGNTYRVTAAIDVPQVSDGSYAVWVCAPGKGGNGCLIGFGDLVYGRLVVARAGNDLTTEAPTGAQAAAEAPAGAAGAAPSLGGSLPWIALVLGGLVVVALIALLVRAQRGRISA